MTSSELTALFDGLLDDAAMFPPEDAPLATAVAGHEVHRTAWYGNLVASFVCAAGRLPSLHEEVTARGIARIDVSLVVPGGLEAIPDALVAAARTSALNVVALEVPCGTNPLSTALRLLTPHVEIGRMVYVELPVVELREQHVHAIAQTGLGLKLRTGGTTLHAFQTEEELAEAIVLCAAERQPFKCTAGLHHAVRNRDEQTMFQHHGFLNIALASRVAAATGSRDATHDILAMRDPGAIAAEMRDLTATDVRAIRALFRSFGTCSITEPVDDLLALGLLP
jgi:hypothetical protein